jgi:hypothetical protein
LCDAFFAGAEAAGAASTPEAAAFGASAAAKAPAAKTVAIRAARSLFISKYLSKV